MAPPADGRPGAEAASRTALQSMLEPRSVAIVGASARPGSFGHRMVTEVRAQPERPSRCILVNPRYAEIEGLPCAGSLADLDGPVDLVLLGVPDAALEEQLGLAAQRGDRAAVVFGSVVGTGSDGRPLRTAVAERGRLGRDGGVRRGLHGLRQRRPWRAGHRVRRGRDPRAGTDRPRLPLGLGVLGPAAQPSRARVLASPCRPGRSWSRRPRTTWRTRWTSRRPRVVALLLETMRTPDRLRAGLARAAELDVPVVALTVGTSGPGAAMVAAHSGALAGGDGAWEALFDAYGVLRVRDLDEMADTLELFAAGRRPRPGTSGIATVHDSGAERAMVVDLADQEGVAFTALAPTTVSALAELLDPGLVPHNPLDVWGTGADTRGLFAASLRAMAEDPGVGAVALAIDLVHEFDGDESYPHALQEVWASTTTPLALLSTMHSALDPVQAGRLRAAGIPVLEGARSGLVALSHLTSYGARVRFRVTVRHRPST